MTRSRECGGQAALGWAVLGLAGMLSACGGGSGTDGSCRTDRDCPAGGHCIDERCVVFDGGADVPPADGDGSGVDAPADRVEVADSGEAGADGDEDGDDDGGAVDDGGGADDGGGDAAVTDAPPTCIDADGDGRGRDCAAGDDCDDADPLHFEDCGDCAWTHAPGCLCEPGETWPCYDGPAGTAGVGPCAEGARSCVGGHLAAACEGQLLPAPVETCGDGVDNDCDGVGDEEAFGPCGDCDVTCRSDGEVEPAPSDPGSTGLGANPDGPGVVLGSEDVRAGYLWAANADGTVSKLDLATGTEVSRYRVGMWGDGCDSPSRTAVDSLGNAYVASRAHVGCAGRNQGSVTKMAGDRRYCVDRDGDTTIATSTGTSPLALGADECVIWRVPVGGAGGIPRALAIDLGDDEHAEGHPWIGCFNEMRGYQLDPDTGAVLATVALSVNTYGFAIDSAGWIWISSRGFNGIQRFHTVTRTVEANIAYGGCGGLPYGIAVDIRNRVWVASYDDAQGCAARYDPADGSWFAVRSRSGWRGRGIAADSDGTIWLAIHPASGGAIVSFHMDDGSGLTVRDIAGSVPVGIGVDELGQVWTVNQASSNVARLNKATGAIDYFPVGPNPYTYSDFTGYQRRLMIPRGTWTRDYERCATDGFDRWGTLSWDADVPAGARLTISAASAGTAAGLDAATPVTLAAVPADAPPVDLTAAFAAAGVPLGRFLRVTVLLEASPDRDSPVFRSIDVQWHCYRMP